LACEGTGIHSGDWLRAQETLSLFLKHSLAVVRHRTTKAL